MSDRVYEIVTERICELLEAGTVPWHQPWNPELGMPRSLSTGKLYRGINVWLLGSSMYASPWWGTYKQIGEHDGQDRKGERSTLVVFWKQTKRTVVDEQTGNETERKGFSLRYYRVFNAEQCEGLVLPDLPADLHDHDPIEAAESIVDGYVDGPGPRLLIGGDRACYSPSQDLLRVPGREAFETREEFYSTAFHEMTHSTGLATRLARKDLLEFHSFGDASYSREELVAEMGASMLSGLAGIDQVTLPNSAAYLAHWVKVLKGDSRLVVTAAAQAQRAADFITGVEHRADTGVADHRVAA
jgi:antirestriction protein ArdC